MTAAAFSAPREQRSVEWRTLNRLLRHPSAREAMLELSGALPAALCARHNSNPIIPKIIAATNTMMGTLSPARLTMAGPGQIPTRPQPTPNSTAPVTSGASRSLRVGQRYFAASSGLPRRRASAKPIEATATAPAMTKASVASHAPKMSRKPSTFSGSVMPEISRPAPKTSPEKKLAMITGMASASEAVPRDRSGEDRGDHEDDCRRDRARRQPREAADAMARGAAIADAGAEADEQAGERDHGHVRCHPRRRQRRA